MITYQRLFNIQTGSISTTDTLPNVNISSDFDYLSNNTSEGLTSQISSAYS